MDETNIKNPPINRTNLDDVRKHTNSVSLENVEKITIRTKNGLVNGVEDGHCKSNKKNAKNNTSPNNAKETKRSKKGASSNLQNHDLDHSNSNIQRKNKSSHKNSSKPDESVIKNCNTIHDEVSKVLTMKTSCSTKELQENHLKPNQSESPNLLQSNKHKKGKSKLNKTEETNINDEKFNLPKFDVTSVISTSESLACEPSSSQLDTNKAHVLDCPGGSSEFEKDLIESIKNIKLQQNTEKVESKAEEAALSVVEEILPEVTYVQYESELQMPMIMKIIQKDLSEPYSIYTYRYFIHNWPKLCFLAMCEEKCVGAIVCKLDFHRKSTKRGYIAMLAVDKDYRKRKIGSTLVRRAITEMISGGADEVVLETEVTNKPALRLYEQLGFVRDKRLFRYYLNGVDALRLKLWLR